MPDYIDFMAEREGFEPPIPLRVCLISSQVHSTGLCHLSALFLALWPRKFVVAAIRIPTMISWLRAGCLVADFQVKFTSPAGFTQVSKLHRMLRKFLVFERSRSPDLRSGFTSSGLVARKESATMLSNSGFQICSN